MSELQRNHEFFSQAEVTLGSAIHAPNRRINVTDTTNEDFFLRNKARNADFYNVSFSPDSLNVPSSPHLQLIGRIILFPNVRINAFSPGIVTLQASGIDLTMLGQPFDQKVGISEGQHFGLSAHAQTTVKGYGEHGFGPMEAGHFSSVLLATQNKSLEHNLVETGDRASHQIIDEGIASTMSEQKMLPYEYLKVSLPYNSKKLIPAFWHRSLSRETGPVQADYADTSKLLIGAGVKAVGRRGVDRAGSLIDSVLSRQGI